MRPVQMVIYWCCCLLPLLSWSQPQSTMLDADDGLSHRYVRNVVQDQNGFLWIATKNGLNRYDGYRFLIYNNSTDNPNRIHHNEVFTILLDRNGKLLVVNSETAVDLLDPQTNELRRLPLGTLTPTLSQIRMWHQSHDGTIHLLTENWEGIYLFRYENEAFVLKWQDRTPRSEVYERLSLHLPRFHLLQGPDQSLWLYDIENGLAILRPEADQESYTTAQSFAPVPFCEQNPRSTLGTVNIFAIDRQGRIWLAPQKDRRLYRFIVGEGCFRAQPGLPADLYYQRADVDSVGNLLVQLGPSVFEPNRQLLIDPQGQLHDYTPYFQVDHFETRYISDDFRETIYVTSYKGLASIDFNTSAVTSYLDSSLQEGSFGISIRGIIEDGAGHLIVATETQGWYKATLPIDHRTQVELAPLTFPGFADEDLRIPKYTRNFVRDSAGYIWASAHKKHLGKVPEGYLLRYDTRTEALEAFVCDARINCLVYTHDHKIWLPGTATLKIFDPQTKQFSDFLDRKGQNPMEGAHASAIIEGDDHLIWIATNLGLLRIDPLSREAKWLRRTEDGSGPDFRLNSITTIHKAPDNKLWLGTDGGGVQIYDPANQSVLILNESDGLADDYIAGILEDGEGGYWISTFSGLSHYDISSGQFRNFTTANGFSHNEFNRYAHYQDSNGYYHFGGMNGVNVFASDTLLSNTPPPRIFLTELTAYDRDQHEIKQYHHQLNPLKKIVLPAKNRYLQLRFALDDYRNTSLNRFAYYLEGYDADWHQLDHRNELTFNNLPAGRYTLHIKGANYQGVWTDQPLHIPLFVHSFFYQTMWFWSVLFVLAAGLGYGLYRYRVNQLVKLLRVRTQIASDLHDEVGGLLVGIAMQSEILELSQQNPKSESLRQIRELSQFTLSKMRDVVWTIDARRDKVRNLLDRMREQANDLLGPQGIRYRIDYHHLDLEQKLPPDLRQEIYLIFKECLVNTIRHSKATYFEVDFGHFEQHFELRISDNGIGLTDDKRHTGLGLDNIRMRAQKIGAKVSFRNTDGLSILLRRRPI